MIIGFCLLVAVVWTLFSLLYDYGLLPSLHDQTRFELFALRDELRGLAIRGQVDKSSFAFTQLETVLNRMTRMCQWYSVSNMLYVMAMMKPDEEASEERQRFDAEASEALKDIERRAMESMMRVLFMNSPVFVVISGAIILTSAAFKRSIEWRNRLMWYDHQSPTNSSWQGPALAR